MTRWAAANAERLGVSPHALVVAGESAGGNLAAAVALRMRDAGDVTLAAQVLIYPGVSGSATFPSREQFDGLVVNRKAADGYWAAYSGGRDLDDDPYAAPLGGSVPAGAPAGARDPRRLRRAPRRRAGVRDPAA